LAKTRKEDDDEEHEFSAKGIFEKYERKQEQGKGGLYGRLGDMVKNLVTHRRAVRRKDRAKAVQRPEIDADIACIFEEDDDSESEEDDPGK
jgi:hypothetical protein